MVTARLCDNCAMRSSCLCHRGLFSEWFAVCRTLWEAQQSGEVLPTWGLPVTARLCVCWFRYSRAAAQLLAEPSLLRGPGCAV